MKNILLFEQENNDIQSHIDGMKQGKGSKKKKRRRVRTRTPASTSGTGSSNQNDPKADTGTVPVVTKRQNIKKATKDELPKLKSVVDKRKNNESKKLKAKIEKRAAQIGILSKKGNNTIDRQRGKKGKTPGASDSGAGAVSGTGTEEDFRNQIGRTFGLEFSSNCMNQLGPNAMAMLVATGAGAGVMGAGYAAASWAQVKWVAEKAKNLRALSTPAMANQRAAIAALSEEIKMLRAATDPRKLTNAKTFGDYINAFKPRSFRHAINSIFGKIKLIAQTGNVAMVGVVATFAVLKLLQTTGAVKLKDETIDELAGLVVLMKMMDNIFIVMLGYSMLDIGDDDDEKANCAMFFAIIGIALALAFVGAVLSKGKASAKEFSRIFQVNLSKYNGEFVEAFRRTFVQRANTVISDAKNPEAKEALQKLRNLLSGSNKGTTGEGGYEAALKHTQETAKKFNELGKTKALAEFDILGQKMLDELLVGYTTTVKQFQRVAEGAFTTAKVTANQVNTKINSNFAAIQKQIQPPAGNLPLKNRFFPLDPVAPAVSRNIDYSKVSQVVAEVEGVFFRGDPLAAINLSRKIGKQFISTVSGKENKVLRSPNAAAVLKILRGIDGTKIAAGGFDTNALRTLLKTLKELKGAPGAPLRMQSLTTQEVAAAYLDDLIFFKFRNFPKEAKRELIKITQLVSRQVDDAAKKAMPGKVPTDLRGKLPLYLGFTTLGVVSSLVAYYVFGGEPIDEVPGAPTEFNGLLPDVVNAYLNSISGTKSYNNISNRLRRSPRAVKGALQLIYSPGGDNFGADYQKGSNGQNDLDWLIEEIADQGKVGPGIRQESINEILVKFATIRQDALINYAIKKKLENGEAVLDDTASKDPEKYARREAAQHLIVNILIFKSGLREKLNDYYSNVHNTSLKGPRTAELKKIFKYDPSAFMSIKNNLDLFDEHYSKDQRKEVDKKIEKLRKEKREREGDQGAPESLLDSPSKNNVLPTGEKIFRQTLPRRVKEEYVDMIERIGLEEGVNPALFAGLIDVESFFRPKAKSTVGAVGLSQLMPKTAKAFGVTDRTDPEQNIRGGMKTLKDKSSVTAFKNAMEKNPDLNWDELDEKGKMRFILYAYNWGAGGLIKTFKIDSRRRSNDELLAAIKRNYNSKLDKNGKPKSDYAIEVMKRAIRFGWDGKSLFISKSSSKSSSKMPARSADTTPRLERERALNLKQRLDKYKNRRGIPRLKPKKIKRQGVEEMSKKNIKELVAEMLNENSGQGYAPYPYGSSVRDDEQPREDYVEEWKAFSLELVRDQSRNMAIEVAKLLVKDLELFEDVLDLAGQNQSVGEEILQKLKDSKQA